MLEKPEDRKRWGDRWWDGQMASLTQWTWIWAYSRRQWRTGKPGVLQSMGSQRTGHSLVTEQQPQASYLILSYLSLMLREESNLHTEVVELPLLYIIYLSSLLSLSFPFSLSYFLSLIWYIYLLLRRYSPLVSKAGLENKHCPAPQSLWACFFPEKFTAWQSPGFKLPKCSRWPWTLAQPSVQEGINLSGLGLAPSSAHKSLN